MRLFILGLILTLMSGCSTIKHQQETHRNLKIEFDEHICKYEKRKLLKNLYRIVEYWEKDFKEHLPSLKIRILSKKNFKCGKVCAIGCYHHSIRQITVVAGKWNHLPALYHEFCHAVFAPVDVEHKHKDWPKWRERQREILRKLIVY